MVLRFHLHEAFRQNSVQVPTTPSLLFLCGHVGERLKAAGPSAMTGCCLGKLDLMCLARRGGGLVALFPICRQPGSPTGRRMWATWGIDHVPILGGAGSSESMILSGRLLRRARATAVPCVAPKHLCPAHRTFYASAILRAVDMAKVDTTERLAELRKFMTEHNVDVYSAEACCGVIA